jgi:hypothetical protein
MKLLKNIEKKNRIKKLKEVRQENKILKKAIENVMTIGNIAKVEESENTAFKLKLNLSTDQQIVKEIEEIGVVAIKYNKLFFIKDFNDRQSVADALHENEKTPTYVMCESFIDLLFRELNIERSTRKNFISILLNMNETNYRVYLSKRNENDKFDFLILKGMNFNKKTKFDFTEENSMLKEEMEKSLNSYYQYDKLNIIADNQKFLPHLLINTLRKIDDLKIENTFYVLKDMVSPSTIEQISDMNITDINYDDDLENILKAINKIKGVVVLFNPTKKEIEIMDKYSYNFTKLVVISTDNLESVFCEKVYVTKNEIIHNDNEMKIEWNNIF